MTALSLAAGTLARSKPQPIAMEGDFSGKPRGLARILVMALPPAPLREAQTCEIEMARRDRTRASGYEEHVSKI